jgi:hypothetical protein
MPGGYDQTIETDKADAVSACMVGCDSLRPTCRILNEE